MANEYVNAGIKEIYLADGTAAFPSDLSNAVGVGVRNSATLTSEPFNEIEAGTQKLKFATLHNVKIEAETLQIDDADLWSRVIAAAKASRVSVAAVTAGASKSGTDPDYVVGSSEGGVFVFDGGTTDDALGADFELFLSPTERRLSLTFERAFPHDETGGAGSWQKLVNDAATNTIPFAENRLPDLDASAVVAGYVEPDYVPTALAGDFTPPRFADFSIKLVSDSTKNALNVSRARRVNVELMAKLEGPDLAAMEELLTNEVTSADVVVTLGSSVTLTFKAGGLSRSGSLVVGDAERSGSFTFSGSYDLDFVSESLGSITFAAHLA